MSTATIILIVILAILAIPMLIAAFKSSEFKVERNVSINKPKPDVFNYIKYLKNQDNFSKWALMDPTMKKDYKGTDGTPGFVSSWDSDNKQVGKGEQEIKSIKEGERIDYNLHFIKPFENRANAYIITETKGENTTNVRWGFTSQSKYPMKLMGLFMNMEKAIGNDFETGLDNLKNLLEKQ